MGTKEIRFIEIQRLGLLSKTNADMHKVYRRLFLFSAVAYFIPAITLSVSVSK